MSEEIGLVGSETHDCGPGSQALVQDLSNHACAPAQSGIRLPESVATN